MTETLTALYDSYGDAEAAIRDLQAAGFLPDRVSMIINNEGERYSSRLKEGNEAGTGAEAGALAGALVGGGAGLLAGLGMLAIPGVGPVVAAGWLVATAAGAVAGGVAGGAGGGLIGSMVGNGVPEADAHVYAEGVRRGGSLVTVRVEDHLVPTAEAILSRHGRVDPDLRGEAYHNSGWTRFDDTAPPYTAEDLERERRVRRNDPLL